ncbi:MAG: cytochrome c oxidase assembly protein [Thermomicrobiales bacterium]
MRPSLPLLHAAGPMPTGWLHSDWRPEPTVVVGVVALAAAYTYLTGPRNRDGAGERIHPVSAWQRTAFLLGAFTLFVSLGPPLDDWSDAFLMTAHMSQHFLLMFVVAPLLMIGTPGWLAERLLAPRWLARPAYALTRALPALVLSNIVIALWHTPFAYDGALRHEPVHVVQHLSFLAAAVILWWPIVGPMPSWPKPAPPLQCLYLFAQTIPGGIIGAFLTLSAPGVYEHYRTVPRIWGISLANDQQIAGLMMWVLTGVIYLLVLTTVFLSWAGREERKDAAPTRPPQPSARKPLLGAEPAIASADAVVPPLPRPSPQ